MQLLYPHTEPAVLSQSLGTSVRLFVQLPGSSTASLLRVLRDETECVGDIIDAIIAKFNMKQRFMGISPDQLQLFKLDSGGSRTLLTPMQTLSQACILEGSRLAVELTAAVQVPLPRSSGERRYVAAVRWVLRYFLRPAPSISLPLLQTRKCTTG